MHYKELLAQRAALNTSQNPQQGSWETGSCHGSKEEVDQRIERAEKVDGLDLDVLKMRDKMKTAFGRIGLTEEKYVMVWDVFQKGPTEAKGRSKEEKIELVAQIAQGLQVENT